MLWQSFNIWFVNQILRTMWMYVWDDLEWKVITFNGIGFLWVGECIFLCHFERFLLAVTTFLTWITLTQIQQSIESPEFDTHNKTNHHIFFIRTRGKFYQRREKNENGLNVFGTAAGSNTPFNYEQCLRVDWILIFLAFDCDFPFRRMLHEKPSKHELCLFNRLPVSQLAFNFSATTTAIYNI